MKKLIIAISLIALFLSCTENSGKNSNPGKEVAFSFAFLTDVHMNSNNMDVSAAGLKQALEHAKSQNIDFVIFGGDLADLDHLQPQDSFRADSLMSVFKSVVTGPE
jgi:predicted MPP superfamily phosphohydrolase